MRARKIAETKKSRKEELGIKNRDKEKDFERRGNFGVSGHGCRAD
jgi:hypothetical protein